MSFYNYYFGPQKILLEKDYPRDNRMAVVGEKDDDLTRLKDAFSMFDVDNNGEISLEELAEMMARHSLHPTREELAEMIKNVDKNCNGSVDLEEFLEMMLARANGDTDEVDIADIFKAFDHDGDGLISEEELRLTMGNLGETLTQDEVRAMLAEADIDGDGKIDFNEFSRLMTHNFNLLDPGEASAKLPGNGDGSSELITRV